MRAPRRGMALPLAMLALVIIAALVAAGFAGALLEQRIGRSSLYALQAAGAAETGAVTVLGTWDTHGFEALVPRGSVALGETTLPAMSSYSPTVRRLNGELFEIRVEGTRHDAEGVPLAFRALSLTVRVTDPTGAGASGARLVTGRAWRWEP